jgi:acylglycerol lipase
MAMTIGIQRHDGTWQPRAGDRFGFSEWMPAGTPKAILVSMHGLSCAAAEFETLAGAIVPAGYAVAAWNLRGQGLDPVIGRRGAFLDLRVLLEDVEDFLAFLRDRHGALPTVIYGDSMGALLAIAAAADARMAPFFEGAILAAPVIDLARNNPAWLRLLLCLAAGLFPNARLSPSFFVHGKSSAPPLSRDPEQQRFAETKPYRLGPLTLRCLVQFGDLIGGANAAAARMNTPTLIIAGGRDVFVRQDQLESFFDRIAASDKTLKIHPESYHQILSDYDKDDALRDIVRWLDARFARAQQRA